MDRERLIGELTSQGIPADNEHLRIVETLGRGGNGVAFLCSGDTIGEIVAKVYIPPDKRDLDDQALGRFQNEIKITSAIRHPYVIPAIGSGIVRVGAYVLPYFLMPQAASTLRSIIGQAPDVDQVQRIARLFLQVCLGVNHLHAHGVIHRDLKPENVLISRDGSAWVADLGIAHIRPDFVSVGLRTMAAERLMNRDYYAPEQRFGSNGDVDGRADIYALGCILYELFVGAPPVRRDSPPVASVNRAFEALDPVIDRMTSYEASGRYPNVDATIIDVALAFGWVTATMRGAREPEPLDVKEIDRLLRSNNAAKRSTGVDLAVTFGATALPILHDLMGHGRREVRNAAASALGEIGDKRSIPYLVAGLQGNPERASTFRPSCDAADSALTRFSVDTRIEILSELREPIRPYQLLQILKGFDADTAVDMVYDLHKRGRLLLDWSESPLDAVIEIDEARAWPEVHEESKPGRPWVLRRRLPRLTTEHQLILARDWVRTQDGSYWDWDIMVQAITQIAAPPSDLIPLLQELDERLGEYPKKGTSLGDHRRRIGRLLQELKEKQD